MRDNSGYSIQVNGGDGIAVGTGNTVTVVKNQKTIHHHRPAGREPGPDDAGLPIMILLGAAFLTAAFAYFLALHADAVYGWARGLSYAGVLILGGGMLLATTRRDEWPEAKSWVLLVLVMVAAVTATAAHRSFSPELGDIARKAHGVNEFWCALSPYGRQQALLHATSTLAGQLPGLLLCLLPIGSFGLREFLGLSCHTKQAESWILVLLGGMLIVGAAFLHTEAGTTTWEEWLPSPPAFTCGRGR